jgi:hypothetical protein
MKIDLKGCYMIWLYSIAFTRLKIKDTALS